MTIRNSDLRSDVLALKKSVDIQETKTVRCGITKYDRSSIVRSGHSVLLSKDLLRAKTGAGSLDRKGEYQA